MSIFDHNYPQSIKVIFNFPEFGSSCIKSAQFIQLFLKYSKFYTEEGPLQLLTIPTQYLLAILNLYHYAKN